MKIEITIETNEGEDKAIFTQDNLSNHNFIELIIKDESYLLPLDDLHSVLAAFQQKEYE